MRKRITVLVMMVFLIVILLVYATTAFAGTSRSSGHFSYELKGNGTAIITHYWWDEYGKDTDIYVPRLIDIYPVTEIGPYC